MSLIPQSAINAWLEQILYAEGVGALQLKGGSLFDGTNRPKLSRGKAKDYFLKEWCRIDWSKRESILPFVEYLEAAYLCPRSERSPHRYLNTELSKCGLKMANGRLSWILGYSVLLPEHVEKPKQNLLERAAR